jgi:hypothetical protein
VCVCVCVARFMWDWSAIGAPSVVEAPPHERGPSALRPHPTPPSRNTQSCAACRAAAPPHHYRRRQRLLRLDLCELARLLGGRVVPAGARGGGAGGIPALSTQKHDRPAWSPRAVAPPPLERPAPSVARLAPAAGRMAAHQALR